MILICCAMCSGFGMEQRAEPATSSTTVSTPQDRETAAIDTLMAAMNAYQPIHAKVSRGVDRA